MPEEILRARISILNLNQDAQYSGAMAIAKIESSPEVQAAMQKLGIGGRSRSISIILEPPAEGRPHLPPSIENLTMDQALDVVARTFRGVVLYGACTQPNLYEIDLVGNMNDEVSNPLSRPRLVMQDKRAGSKGRLSLCLHIVFCGSIALWHGAMFMLRRAIGVRVELTRAIGVRVELTGSNRGQRKNGDRPRFRRYADCSANLPERCRCPAARA